MQITSTSALVLAPILSISLGAPGATQCTKTWTPIVSGVLTNIFESLERPNGDLVLCGQFTTLAGKPIKYLAQWDGSTWSAIGSSSSWRRVVMTMLNLRGGDLLVGGMLHTAVGDPANGVARWNGSSWLGLGAGIEGTVSALLQRPNGDVIAGGAFQNAGGRIIHAIARWDGASWSTLGAGLNAGSVVRSLATMPNGDLIAGGTLIRAGSAVAHGVLRWNGTVWTTLGTGLSGLLVQVKGAVVLPNGDLVVGGTFNRAGGTPVANVARWDGNSWSAMGAGLGNPLAIVAVEAVTALPNGEVVAGGTFNNSGTASVNNIARWDGTTWQPFGSGANGGILGLSFTPGYGLTATGRFSNINGVVVTSAASLRSSCPAAATPYGSACPSSGGNNRLAAVSLPWIGSTYHARGTGLPARAFVAQVVGLGTTNIPLQLFLPNAGAGCALLATTESVTLSVVNGGTADALFPVPNDTSLAGLQLYHQLGLMELGAQGQVVASTASNGLVLTIGAF